MTREVPTHAPAAARGRDRRGRRPDAVAVQRADLLCPTPRCSSHWAFCPSSAEGAPGSALGATGSLRGRNISRGDAMEAGHAGLQSFEVVVMRTRILAAAVLAVPAALLPGGCGGSSSSGSSTGDGKGGSSGVDGSQGGSGSGSGAGSSGSSGNASGFERQLRQRLERRRRPAAAPTADCRATPSRPSSSS